LPAVLDDVKATEHVSCAHPHSTSTRKNGKVISFAIRSPISRPVKVWVNGDVRTVAVASE
jgi:hypothetical protein